MPELFEREFKSEPGSVRAARDFVRAALRVWDVDDVSDVAILLTSELVTNAVLHARTAFHLAARYRPPELVIEVHDDSCEKTEFDRLGDLASAGELRMTPGYSLSGRGLGLVGAMAARWGVRMEGLGKTVWFGLLIPTTTQTGSVA